MQIGNRPSCWTNLAPVYHYGLFAAPSHEVINQDRRHKFDKIDVKFPDVSRTVILEIVRTFLNGQKTAAYYKKIQKTCEYLSVQNNHVGK